jgi:hypothetical protein
MAAGFTMKKNNIKLLDNFIQNDYLKKISNRKSLNKYDFSYLFQQLKIN